MTTASEVRRLKWMVFGVSLIASFATGHWVAGLILLFVGYVEAHEEPEL